MRCSSLEQTPPGGKPDFGTAAELKWVGNTPSTKIKATTLRQKAQRVARPPAAARPPAFSAAFLVWKAAFHSSPEIEKPASNFTTKLPRSDRKHRGTALGHHQVSTLDFSLQPFPHLPGHNRPAASDPKPQPTPLPDTRLHHAAGAGNRGLVQAAPQTTAGFVVVSSEGKMGQRETRLRSSHQDRE